MARPLEFDRCEAVAKARDLFHRHGYEATSIDDLTQAIGISRASLYNSFGDKHGLMLETLDSASRENEEMRAEASSRNCGAKKIVRELFESLAASEHVGCYLLTLGAELGSSDPDVKQRVQATLDANRETFAGLLAREGGLTAKQIEAKSAALLGSMVAILTLTRVYPRPELLKPIIQQALTVLD